MNELGTYGRSVSAAFEPLAEEDPRLREEMAEMAGRLRTGRDARLIRTPRYAGFWRRLLAFLIDGGVLMLFTVPLSVAGIAGIKCAALATDGGVRLAADDALSVLLSFGWPVMAVSYFSVLHGSAGQTIGKAVLGIRVLSSNLHAIGLVRATVRAVAYGLSALVFGLGFLIVAFTPRKRGWHDYLAGTCVVRLLADET